MAFNPLMPVMWAIMFWGLIVIGFWWMLRQEHPWAVTVMELLDGGYKILLDVWDFLEGMGKKVG